MTWRTFCILLAYLPPEAVLYAVYQSKSQEIKTIDKPQELAQFLGI